MAGKKIPRHQVSLRETLRRQIETFCGMLDASELEDAARALPAQRETLDRDCSGAEPVDQVSRAEESW
jgi:hypothetical protein